MATAQPKPANPCPLTRVEYEELVRRGALDDARVELIDGRVISMSPQGESHSYSVSQLMTLLVRALGDRARVRVQSPLAGPDESEPEPDIAVVAPGMYLDEHPRTAALVIEVADTSLAHDRSKARLYAKAGVSEFWIVNLRQSTIEVHRSPGEGGYAAIGRHERAEHLSLVCFPDVVIAVADVLPPARQGG